MKPARHLLEAWEQIHRSVRRARPVVLLTDFDGTLVRIQSTPERVRLSGQIRVLLAALARQGVIVGVVSGRRLGDVRRQVGLRGIWYAGSHGLALCAPHGKPRWQARIRLRREMVEVQRMLARELQGLEGVFLEPKDACVAVHYRNASRRSQEAARRVVLRVVQDRTPALQLLSGKKVWELLPAGPISKWRAVQQILRHTPNRRRLVFYVGDDVSDEGVFKQLHGVSIVVGRRHRTAARFFVRSEVEVGQFLLRLREALPPHPG